MTHNNETVSRQNFWVVNIEKSMTAEGNSVLLLVNVDQRRPLQRGLTNFQLYLTNHLQTGLLGNSSFRFPKISASPHETLRFSGNKIKCFLRDQSWSGYCFLSQQIKKVRMNILPWLKNLWIKRRIYLFWNTGNLACAQTTLLPQEKIRKKPPLPIFSWGRRGHLYTGYGN